MPKRRAEESFEENGAHDQSTPSKKSKIQSQQEEAIGAVNGAATNGHHESPAPRTDDQYEAAAAVESRHNMPVDGQEEDEEDVEIPSAKQKAPAEGYDDLYLDTIDRKVLDFDFEKLCSVTLSNINVYACLVCGKYYQGRGPRSQAYFHALEDDHHVYINMETKNVYVLPEGYEVTSKSLEDIKFVVDPRLAKEEVLQLDKVQKQAWDLLGRKYIPGYVGMNNIKANDYFNVVMHALAHVPPIRSFFMLEDLSKKSPLPQRFSTLIRKIWNPRAFKSHVSPHELLQEIAVRSSKKFTLTEQSDPVEFLSWFLNNLHLALGGSKTKPGSSIVQKVFQGTLQIESQLITARADAGDRLRFEDADSKIEKTRFMILTLDLPAAPLFQDEFEENIIPHVPLYGLDGVLNKYNGIQAQERMNHRRRYRLLHPLPPYLLFHIKRFSSNKFVSERNPTIVTFDASRPLDMSPYIVPNPELHPHGDPVLYDLVANITHEAVKVRDDSVEGEAERKVWKCQLLDRTRSEWVEIQDLFVERVNGELISTKESYVQVWERRRPVKSSGVGRAKNK